MKKGKIIGLITAFVMTGTLITQLEKPKQTLEVQAAPYLNYAEALQKSLYFYEVQQAGVLPEWNRVDWRDDSLVNYFIPGGWYDAGDLLKFNLPMAYSATMLAWGMYQYPDGLKAIGQYDTYRLNLEFALDYFAACDLGDEFVFQCGDTQTDHAAWQSVEIAEYGYGRGKFADVSKEYAVTKDSAVGSMMATALASGYLAVKDSDPVKAANYLAHAENLFKIADKTRSDDAYNKSPGIAGIYASSHFYDNLFFAANFLYQATGKQSYLTLAESYIDKLPKTTGTNELAYGWGVCWDDVTQAGILLYAQNTQDEYYAGRVKRHLDYWLNNEETVVEVPGGMKWLTNWGSLRHATTTSFVAAVACDTVLKNDGKKADYIKMAETQVNFALGDNPKNFSYLVGYGDNYPKSPHHRTAHATWGGAVQRDPVVNRHILYGALVGGPDADGKYVDDRNEYIYTEVTTDYNAGFTAMLCNLVQKYGGAVDPNFPEPEPRNDISNPDSLELFVVAKISESSASGVTLKLNYTNHTAWPTRVVNNVSYRVFLDLSEVKAAGKNPEDLVIRCDRDESGKAKWSKPTQYKAGSDIYYIEVTYADGTAALPFADDYNDSELILALVMPDYASGWNSDNDFSVNGVKNAKAVTDKGEKGVIVPEIPVYVNGVLFFGIEPDGTTPQPSTPSTKPTVTTTKPPATTTTATTKSTTTTATPPSTTTSATRESASSTTAKSTTSVTTAPIDPTAFYGDVDENGKINVSDAVYFAKYLAGKTKLSEQALKNANCNRSTAGTDVTDLLAIIKFIFGEIESLPI